MEIRPVGVELFHADRRTEMTKVTVTFRSYSNAPKGTKTTLKEGRKKDLARQMGSYVGRKALSTNLINDVNTRDVNVILKKVFFRL